MINIFKLILPKFVKNYIKKFLVFIVKVGSVNMDDNQTNLKLIKIEELIGMIEILNHKVQMLENEIHKANNYGRIKRS